MARIEWVKSRLSNWALWRAKSDSMGLGYASSSVLLAIPSGGNRDAPLPVLEIEAEETNRAVESLKLGKGHLYMTLHLVYIKNTGVKRAARLMHRGESTIKAQLDQADHLLAQWFTEQDDARRRARATQASGGFTA